MMRYPDSPVLKVCEAAELAGTDDATIRRLFGLGELRGFRFGPHSLRIVRESLLAWMEREREATEIREIIRAAESEDAPPSSPCLLPEIATPAHGGGVYFLHGGDRLKIGYSVNAERRLAALRRTCPIPLRLVGWLPGAPEVERMLHDELRAYREYAEWFTVCPAIVATIRFLGADETVRAKAHRTWLPIYRCEALLAIRLELRRSIATDEVRQMAG